MPRSRIEQRNWLALPPFPQPPQRPMRRVHRRRNRPTLVDALKLDMP